MPNRQKFTLTTDVDAALLEELRSLARGEGRQIQNLVEEATAALIDQRRQARARPHVVAVYKRSHARFSALYDKLAK